jgi:hypothetical protein
MKGEIHCWTVLDRECHEWTSAPDFVQAGGKTWEHHRNVPI